MIAPSATSQNTIMKLIHIQLPLQRKRPVRRAVFYVKNAYGSLGARRLRAPLKHAEQESCREREKRDAEKGFDESAARPQ